MPHSATFPRASVPMAFGVDGQPCRTRATSPRGGAMAGTPAQVLYYIT